MRTETIAVVTNFAWYVTWKTGAVRFDYAVYNNEFWTKYKSAGIRIFNASYGRSMMFALIDSTTRPFVAKYSKTRLGLAQSWTVV